MTNLTRKSIPTYMVTLFLLHGCMSTTTLEYIEIPPEDVAHLPIEKKADAHSLPDWIISPPKASSDRYYFVVSATQQELGGIDAQKRTAVIKAQANYSKQIKSVIKSEQQLTSNHTGTQFEESITETSLNTTKLDSLSILKEWIDPNSKELFLLMQAPL